MGKSRVRHLGLILAVLLVLAGVIPVSAADPGAAASPPVVEVQFEDSGDWVLLLPGAAPELSSQAMGVWGRRLGLGLPPLTLDSSYLTTANDAGVAMAALVKQGKDVTLFLNGEPLTTVSLGEVAVSSLTQGVAPGLDQLVTWLSQTRFATVVRLPAGQGIAVDLAKSLSPSDLQSDALNMIDVGLTISPQGQLLSIAGVDASALGLNMSLVDPAVLEVLPIEELTQGQLGLMLVGDGMAVSVAGEDWLSLGWDAEYLLANAGKFAQMAGVSLSPEQLEMAALAEGWLSDTRLSADVFLADEPREGEPWVELGRPVGLSISDGWLYAEGVNTGLYLGSMVSSYAEQLGTAVLTWDGEARLLRWAVNDKVMPPVSLEPGITAKALDIFLPGYVPSGWGPLDPLLDRVRLTALVVYEDTPAPNTQVVEHELKTDRTLGRVHVPVTVSRLDGRVAVWGQSLPLAAMGAGIPTMVRDSLGMLAPDTASVVVGLGAEGVDIGLDGQFAHMRWDPTTRGNLTDVVLDLAVRNFGMPTALTSGLGRACVDLATGLMGRVGLYLDITVTDEAVPTGSLEELVNQFAR